MDRQVTRASHGHVLTNDHVWSNDSKWIVYDVRSDAGGTRFDGASIHVVRVGTGEVREAFRARHGAHVGVAMFSRGDGPGRRRIVFIHGPERPSDTWRYSACHRRGVTVECGGLLDARDGCKGMTWRPEARTLDARDLLPPFTPGALRGGTHVHQFSPDGAIVSSTYEDHVLSRNDNPSADAVDQRRHERNHRGIALTVLDGKGGVAVSHSQHPRNHSGEGFTVLATKHTDDPSPGSNDITRAVEEAWIGERGYARDAAAGGGWQRRALAFLGEVVLASGERVLELFALDIPEDPGSLRIATGPASPLQGTSRTRPCPPVGVSQRRLTDTSGRSRPGLSQGGVTGPRFWPRSSRCGTFVAVVALDDGGVPQLFTVLAAGTARAKGDGGLRQVTWLPSPGVESAFTWHPTEDLIAFVHDGSVCVVHVAAARECSPSRVQDAGAPKTGGGGRSRVYAKQSKEEPAHYEGVTRLTRRRLGEGAPRPEAAVFSPCGRHVAYVRRVQVPAPDVVTARKPPRGVHFLRRAKVKLASMLTRSEDAGALEPSRRVDDKEERAEEEWYNQVCVVTLKWGLKRGVETLPRQAMMQRARAAWYLRYSVDEGRGFGLMKRASTVVLAAAAVWRFAAVRGLM